MQYVPSASPIRSRPMSKGSEATVNTSQNLAPQRSTDSSTLRSFMGDNETSRRVLHESNKKDRTSDFDLLESSKKINQDVDDDVV